MKQTIRNTVSAALLLAAINPALTAIAGGDLRTEAEQAIKALTSADWGLTNFFNGSAGFVVFPSVGKGGLVIGGERGKGVLYEKGKPIGEATLTEINVGPQIGGQSFYEVIFFENPEALANFKQSNF
jgi:lipid-binding SYLF domain-containing protein